MTDTIATLQAAIVTILTTTATDLTGLTVLTSDDLQVDEKIEQALSGTGLCAVIITPDLNFLQPWNVDAKTYIRVIERPLQNRGAVGTGYAGSWWAIHIAAWLWDASVGADWDILTVRSIIQEYTPDTLEWVITLETSGCFKTETDPPVLPPETPP